MSPLDQFQQGILRRAHRHFNNAKIFLQAMRVAALAKPAKGQGHVLFFKASSGIDDLSWNSAFQLLTTWGLRVRGVPVRFFACSAGMELCILGTNRDDATKKPPCASCIYQSKTLTTGASVSWFNYQPDSELDAALVGLSLSQLVSFVYKQIPIGELVLPGTRWILRRHNLLDDANTRLLLTKYIRSAYNILRAFEGEISANPPRTVVVFNGQFFPEAVVKWAAQRHGIRVISHEVGLRPMTAFFTEGESTAYPIDIPQGFHLSEHQNKVLDETLEKRFQGEFSMGGIRFWQEIKGFDEVLESKIAKFKAMVPVFTNVVFDTSQPHANTLFTDMFTWLDEIAKAATEFPETLFVIRAHPDETRARKASLETVENWVRENKVFNIPNIHFIPPTEFISSYALVQRSDLVLIYNSTIGMEAVLMGKYVLCAGRARFTQLPIVDFPVTHVEYLATLRQRLQGNIPSVDPIWIENARNFLYFQLFRSSLPFSNLMPSIRATHAGLKLFNPRELNNDSTIDTIYKGLFEGGNFLSDEDRREN